ncbi:MAG TPA: hypothetical protein VG126_04860 [Thermoleophilaceae bacterium]|nr:hypothetical protein [Thermoleophilaceae bacterium]
MLDFRSRHVPIRTALLALVAVAAVALTLPAAASASAPNGRDRLKARGACADERGLTRAKHQRFRLKYGAGARNRNAFNRCVKIKARAFARRRAGGGGGLPGLGLPGLPGMPTLPGGIPEMPGVRAECQISQMEDPLGFTQEYPGGIETCVLMESMP